MYYSYILLSSKSHIFYFGSDKDVDVFETLLKIISRGTFPSSDNRSNLTKGQRRQLRDAMILTAHIREKRDIFVTNDIKGFIGKDGDIRNEIENIFDTKIVNKDEFISYLKTI